MNVSGCTLRVRCILHHTKIDLARKTCLPDKRRVRNIQHGPTGVQTLIPIPDNITESVFLYLRE